VQPLPGRFRRAGDEGAVISTAARPAAGRPEPRGDDHTSFAGGDLRDVNGYGGVFSSANFGGANLTNATVVGAYLQGANFSGATLSGVNFSGAEMDHAVGLTQGQLAGACGDEATTLPRGPAPAPLQLITTWGQFT